MRLIFKPVLFFLLIFISKQVIGQDDNIKYLIKKVNEQIAKKDFEEALNNSEIAIDLCNCPGAYLLNAFVHVEMNNLKLADKSIKKASDLWKTNVPYLEIAIYKSGKGLFEEAYKDVAFAFKKDSTSKKASFAYLVRGELKRRQKRYEEAYIDFTKAFQLDDKNLKALSNMINQEIYKKQIDKATANLALFNINDKDRSATYHYSSRAMHYVDLNKYDLVVADAGKALQLDSTNYIAVNALALSQVFLKQYEEAIRNFNKISDKGKTDAQWWNNKGWALIHLNRLDEALSHLSKAFSIDPNLPMIYNNRGYILFKKGGTENAQKALTDYDKAIEVGGKNYDPYWKYKDSISLK